MKFTINKADVKSDAQLWCLLALLFTPCLSNCAGTDAHGRPLATGGLAGLPVHLSVRGPGGRLASWGNGGYRTPWSHAASGRRTSFVGDMFKNPDGTDKYTKEDWERFGKLWNDTAKKNAQAKKAQPQSRQSDWFSDYINAGAERDRRIDAEREEAWREAAYR